MYDVIFNDKKYVANTYSRFPIVITGGKGSVLYGGDGKEYIDLGSGIGVTAFGTADEEWINAVTRQLNSFQHTSNLYYAQPCAQLAETLCKRTKMRKAFLCNSGAEANECAIKTARKYAAERHGEDCYNIITLKNSFHGRTITTLAATGQEVFHKSFRPLTAGFLHAAADDFGELEKLASENKTAAVMIECVQGEGGVAPLDEEFVASIDELCKSRDILLICDEVQSGNGRTGKLYSYMHYGLKPDIFTTAKGLGGGLPVGACVFGEKTENVLTYGDHGSTFGGNPAAAAGALNVLSRLNSELFREVTEKGDYIFRELTGAEGVVSIAGKGLMIGIKTERPVKDVVTDCMNKGVLCLIAKDKLRLLPALNIPFGLLKKAVEIIKGACAG